ncbi:MAG: Tetratricopeptide 2 repeat protein [Deltaproteobacteria bacterium]|nr:Tetratricopeptide 2 repeat protein [Deltaproteobacteria bacterium]
MGSWRWLHAFAVLAIVGRSAAAQPTGAGSGSGSGSAIKPAGSSAVESSDVPPWQPSPARFAVSPFENHANVRAFDWLVAGAPFEISEKTEDVLGLEPTGGTFHVGGTTILPEPEPVAAFGVERHATWVITGWVDRPNWNLRLAITLWKVTPGKPPTAVVAAEAQRTGDPKTYHQLLGEALAEVWSKGGAVQIDLARAARLARPLATDIYAVNLMSRGLGQLTGALGAVNLKAAEHDFERAVFIDPKCFEAQRLLGELYLALSTLDPKAGGDPRYAARAASKFAYANDLAPDDIASLRAAATGAARGNKPDVARDLLRKLVTRKPWDLDARYELGTALWQTGDANGAERQLTQVTTKQPDHLPARRVLVLIHASHGDTSKLVSELEAIAARAPLDLEVKADLATAYGSINRWDRATAALEQIAVARPNDLALFIRIGDAKRRLNDLEGALGWYARAGKLAPDSSLPGFAAAQTLFDAGRMPEAIRIYNSLQKFRDDLPATETALGAIALVQDRPNDAAWYLRRAVVQAPRVVISWRGMIAAELGRKDPQTALRQLERALLAWPRDGQLLYLAGVAHAMTGERKLAREKLQESIAAAPGLAAARAALGQLDAGGSVTLTYTPELVRPWGDAQAIVEALDRFAAAQQQMATSRAAYQDQFLKLLGALGKGPYAPTKKPLDPTASRMCPIGRVAPLWASAQDELRHYERIGGELEAAYRFIARHDEIGATAALLPNARAQVNQARRSFRTALADVGELRAEWARGLVPELRLIGCNDKLLAAAVADPARYRIIEEDKPDTIPQTQPTRPKPRATFYIDNTRCPDAVDVWVDGSQVGQVAPGRRTALVSDGGERTLCLIVPGAAQCGDRGTVRQVYLHDGWTATMNCPK